MCSMAALVRSVKSVIYNCETVWSYILRSVPTCSNRCLLLF